MEVNNVNYYLINGVFQLMSFVYYFAQLKIKFKMRIIE